MVLKLDANGDYPACADSCILTVDTAVIDTQSVPAMSACTPDTSTPAILVDTPDISIDTICSTVGVSETGMLELRPGVICSPASGAALFISDRDAVLRVYSVDGRLRFAGVIRKGRSRIVLETGVYLWRAGQFKGKVVVR